MATDRAGAAQFLPVLSAGKHRRPGNGACVMEYASYLAGEKWSDHPACTNPLLGELARQINDFIGNQARPALLELVPDLIGATSADLRIDLRIALRAAQTALPVVAEPRQRMMAVAVLICERLAAELDGCPGASLSPDSSAALALAPSAATWACRTTRTLSISPRAFRRRMAPTIVRYAVQGIAHADIPDPDPLLHQLLARAIEDCKSAHTAQRLSGQARNHRVARTRSPQSPNATSARAVTPSPTIIR